MTPEYKVKVKIREVLKAHGAYYHMPVQNGLGAPSLDFIGCYYSNYFAVEAKAPGKKMTPRQVVTAREIAACYGKVFLIDGDTKELEEWLGNIRASWLGHQVL